MTFFWIWLASVIVQLVVGFIGRFLPKPKFSGGYDPMYFMLWVPVVNTIVAIVCLVLVPMYFWKKRKKT